MINKKFIFSLILLFGVLLIFFCFKEDYKINKIEKIDLSNVVDNIEKQRILFDSSIDCFSRIDRIKTILIRFSNDYYYSLVLLNPDSLQRSIMIVDKDSIHGRKDTNRNYDKCIKFVDTLMDIFRINKINSMSKAPFETNSKDSTWLEFETFMYDSSFYELKQTDKNYFDHSIYVSGGVNLDTMKEKRYYYVLIYKYNDSLNSKRYKELVNCRTVNKICDHWYYYRTYGPVFSDEYYLVNWENYNQFLKSDGNMRDFEIKIGIKHYPLLIELFLRLFK